MKVLTVKAPWSWLIIHGGKPVENRSRSTSYRGPLLIQTSKRRPPAKEFDSSIRFARTLGIEVPIDELEFGGIIGRVELVACHDSYDSPWFVGPFAWEIRNPVPLPFIPIRGQINMFDAPLEVLRQYRML